MHQWDANLLWGCPRVSHPHHNNARDDFRPQVAPGTQFHWFAGTPAPTPCAGTPACSGFGFRAAASSCAPLAPPGGSSAVRVPVRHHWSYADDPAVASRVGRQSPAPALSHTARHLCQRLRAGHLHRIGRTQCLDRVLGGHAISGRMNVVRRSPFAICDADDQQRRTNSKQLL